ncbi:MAG: Tm-1-like ATP-binding domain-containing protein [Rhodobacteraceae bacterium]|nr:Tm-1-like ATP-binding domain-containing protein [Paracoccaceae bacterium]
MTAKTILMIGTFDTKSDELAFLRDRIEALGGRVLAMDVGVLGDPQTACDISRHDVAAAAGHSIDEVIALGGENPAFQVMARGAAALTAQLVGDGRADAMIALGGTMGTDLALDCAQALPLGVPKYIVSTVAFSPLIPPHRLAADTQMILWAGGLYGMNDLCRSSLAQAAGAVHGAALAAQPPVFARPQIGMTSLGSSCLKYMKILKPALEARGYDVSVFHSTGMGGMAFERLAAAGTFACVFDLCMQELVNEVAGSAVSSGKDRLCGAGAAGTPQIVAPGALDLLDFACWQEVPAAHADKPFHQHNRLITSAVFSPDERRANVRAMADRLARARGPVHVLIPAGGVQEWDRPGGDIHDPDGLAAMLDEMHRQVVPHHPNTVTPAHINDPAFCDAALAVFDDWRARGIVPDAPPRDI